MKPSIKREAIMNPLYSVTENSEGNERLHRRKGNVGLYE
jgi:hypothetical protein